MTRVLSNLSWLAMLLLALLVAALSTRFFLLPADQAAPPPLLPMFLERNTIFMMHIIGGTIALATGAWNFLERSRARFLNLHRWLGRIYLVSVLVGGIAGFSLAFTAQGGLSARIGFGMLAVVWLVTAVFAYLRIRAYDIESHRRWMIRNYAMTFAAVTLRLWLPALGAAGYSFPEAYTTVAWLSWVPNLIVAEIIVARKHVVGG